jgi:ubiquinol-cytochrome c reductase cytochrome c1 subunit
MNIKHLALIGAAAICGLAVPALAQDSDAPTPPAHSWSFSGPFGRFDLAAARRGLQVYTESCAGCHSMSLLHYRDLSGIGLSQDQIRTIAASVDVPAGIDGQGNVVRKPATPADQFRAPFLTEDAARAAMNGALPSDLSLAAVAYANGPNYLYAFLTGYSDPPAGTTLADDMSYNKYFPGHLIAMPQVLSDGQITYADGTASTVAQNAQDLVTFLSWAANPEMDRRKSLGLRVVLYFAFMAAATYLLKRKIWSSVR